MEPNITKEVLAFIAAVLNDDQGISTTAIDALHELRYAAETGSDGNHKVSVLGTEIGKLLDACRATEDRYYIPFENL